MRFALLVSFLIGSGLLHIVMADEESVNGLFEVTLKGKEFLRAYRGLKALME